MSGRSRHTGFTLIELLVALMIFAVLSVMAYGGLNLVLDARERMSARTDLLAELQMSFTLIGRDIEQAINRPVRDEFGDPRAALTAIGGLMEFTRAGWRNPAGLPRSELQRVSYYLDGDELKRLSWPTLDRTQANEPVETVLLGEVEDFEFRFLLQDGEWQDFWPPAADADAGVPGPALPRVVEITLVTAHWGRVSRLFRTTGVMDAAPGPGAAPAPTGGPPA